MSDAVQSEIIAAEQRRCAAMLANDPAAVEPLLDERLVFSHATGLIDDKAAYLAKMAAGRIDYLSIHWDEQTIIPLGEEAALVTGKMVMQVRVEGVEKQLNNRVLIAWARTGGSWRVVAFQSTPLKV